MAIFPYLFSAGCPDWVSIIIDGYNFNDQKPAYEITSINPKEHLKVLEAINNLPYDQTQIRIYVRSIEELFAKYEIQVSELAQTLSDYDEVAKAIRNLQTLMGQRKYIKVRRQEGQMH
jgi:hypothetical protein